VRIGEPTDSIRNGGMAADRTGTSRRGLPLPVETAPASEAVRPRSRKMNGVIRTLEPLER
jgi:hypothetical protein